MGSLAMSYAVYVQYRIYAAGPCYNQPLKCGAARSIDNKTGEITILHNQVHVAVPATSTLAYFFVALSEIFASVTGSSTHTCRRRIA